MSEQDERSADDTPVNPNLVAWGAMRWRPAALDDEPPVLPPLWSWLGPGPVGGDR